MGSRRGNFVRQPNAARQDEAMLPLHPFPPLNPAKECPWVHLQSLFYGRDSKQILAQLTGGPRGQAGGRLLLCPSAVLGTTLLSVGRQCTETRISISPSRDDRRSSSKPEPLLIIKDLHIKQYQSEEAADLLFCSATNHYLLKM